MQQAMIPGRFPLVILAASDVQERPVVELPLAMLNLV